jgi:hypothetical protein
MSLCWSQVVVNRAPAPGKAGAHHLQKILGEDSGRCQGREAGCAANAWDHPTTGPAPPSGQENRVFVRCFGLSNR